MTWPNATNLPDWLSLGAISIHFTHKSRMVECQLTDVRVVFCCDFGICIEWGQAERFIPWYHVDHIERQTEKPKRV